MRSRQKLFLESLVVKKEVAFGPCPVGWEKGQVGAKRNEFDSVAVSVDFSMGRQVPERYLINFLLDATVGMLLIYVGVRAVSVLVEWQQWESLRFGEY
ncbi:hypothetical protein A6R68_08865, partial [Neotoma lepida]